MTKISWSDLTTAMLAIGKPCASAMLRAVPDRTRFLFGMLTLLSALGFTSPAMADAYFTGTLYFDAWCDDCTPLVGGGFGEGPASATLSLQNYQWGEDLGSPDLRGEFDPVFQILGFTYTSERMGALAPPYPYNVSGSILNLVRSPAEVRLQFQTEGPSGYGLFSFWTHADGKWQLWEGDFPASDVGPTSSWGEQQVLQQQVPEPATYAMLFTGLGLLGFMARRRKPKEAA